MTDPVVALAAAMVAIDSRSSVSNIAVADLIEQALPGFEIERLDYTDPAGVAKRALVAHKGPMGGGLALSGHMDTVPDTGWQDDPWSGRIADGRLHGLGSTDMKGPLAACIEAAKRLPDDVPITLLVTTDEETTKQGARLITTSSELVRRAKPAAILVAEPTGMVPVRGHRSSINFVAVATGVQAHSSTGIGRNANWDLVAFLADMKAIHEQLRDDPAFHDAAYDPVFSDFNCTIDNHGAPVNMTVPKATVRIKFRYSASIDPEPIVAKVRVSAERSGLALDVAREGLPPETPSNHPLIRLCSEVTGKAAITVPFGTDACELQPIAPCVVLGPGDIGEAHRPGEFLEIARLLASVEQLATLAERVARAGW
ncbi:MAG: M20/M25/M40 family metallo-hydrolase [Hyphomicrobiaceae bacterium]